MLSQSISTSITYCSTNNNNNVPKRTIKIPPKKVELGKKLKFALFYCDIESANYRKNKEVCDIIWDEVDNLAKEIKDNNN